MHEERITQNNTKKKILFVDDEPNVLMGLKRMVRPMRHDWDASFANSGQEALQMMGESRFDVLVSDMRMPGLDGAMLLNEVANTYPQTIRILLSGQCDMDAFIGSACPAHQFLSKPCDASTLNATVNRAMALRKMLDNTALRAVVMQMNILPSPPAIYLQIERALRDDNASMEKIGSIIDADLGMSAKLLQLVNSPFFGFTRTIETPTQAATLLGVNTVQFIMLHLQAFTILDSRQEQFITHVSGHCMQVAQIARAIVEMEGGSPLLCSDAYIAGMLHDLGKLVLTVNMPKIYQSIQNKTQSMQEIRVLEQQQAGVTHAEVGAYLMGLWGLPAPIVDIVEHHHNPGESEQENLLPLAAVHVANVLERLAGQQQQDENNTNGMLDAEFLESSGFGGRIDAWKACCIAVMEASNE